MDSLGSTYTAPALEMKWTLLLAFAFCAVSHAQQPFLTDDADTATKNHFHLEIISEHDRLQSLSYPTLRQNTTRIQTTYGLLGNLEIGFDAPVLAIYNAHESGTTNAFGFGDLNLQIKYRLHTEHEESRLPAFTVALYIEVPTGDSQNQLGSGRTDYWLNAILQKKLSPRFTYRLNAGLLFSGNTLTGAIGIDNVKGRVYTGASSITYQLTPKWLVGAEIAGAFTQQISLGKAQLQTQFGAKYALNKIVGLDFAITGGKYEGSPKLGAAFGFSFDF